MIEFAKCLTLPEEKKLGKNFLTSRLFQLPFPTKLYMLPTTKHRRVRYRLKHPCAPSGRVKHFANSNIFIHIQFLNLADIYKIKYLPVSST